MSNHYDVSALAPFDSDGMLQETAARINRRQLIRGGGLMAVGAGVFGGLAPMAFAQSKGDIDILNFALTLEYLEAAFYEEALGGDALDARTRRFAVVVGEHEAEHVTALKATLKSKAVKEPSFDFQGTTKDLAKFTATAIVLEDTGVRAYQGAAGDIKSKDVLAAAISIHPVEARHAAWIRNIDGQPPAPDAFNPADDMATVLAAVNGTMFIQSNATAGSSGAATGTPTVAG